MTQEIVQIKTLTAKKKFIKQLKIKYGIPYGSLAGFVESIRSAKILGLIQYNAIEPGSRPMVLAQLEDEAILIPAYGVIGNAGWQELIGGSPLDLPIIILE
jgi:hypothetical protein